MPHGEIMAPKMATDAIEILSQIKKKLKRMSGLNAAHEIRIKCVA